MRKTKAQAQKTREQLLQSALDTFYEHGVARTSLQAIARNAGVTRGALYWHFKNKEDLFDALFLRKFEESGQSFAEAIEKADTQGLRQLLFTLFEHITHDENHRKLTIIMGRKCEYTEENRAVLAVQQKYIDIWTQRIRHILTLCASKGELPPELDINLASDYLYVVISGLIDTWLNQQSDGFGNAGRPILNAPLFPLLNAALFTLQHAPDLRKPAPKP
ncbi:MAG: TetR family transcriptional regulator [Neisseria sp.]|nr:TetR family transcriptional regulator [Neisseria sp.]